MLDLFTVFSKGGVVLYSKSSISMRPSAVDGLVANYFVEARLGETTALIGNQKFHWTFSNELDLVFVVVYQKILQLNYVEELLTRLRDLFCSLYRTQIAEYFSIDNKLEQTSCGLNIFDFDGKYESTLKAIETKYSAQSKSKGPRRFEETKKYQNSLEAAKKTLEMPGSSLEESAGESTLKGSKGKSKGKGKSKASKDEKPESKDEKKKGRVWEGKVTSSKLKALDYSDVTEDDDTSLLETLVNEDEKGVFNDDGLYEVKDIEGSTEKTKPSRFMGLLNSLTGQHVISAEELDPVLASMKEHLVNKNVANDIAAHLCDSVKTTIVGKKLGSFQSLSSAVSDSLRDSITRILTPGASVDILKEIHAANAAMRPYVMAFIGVNGVGKSTNLSKTCFWLLQNKKRVLIAACDTFRSGAVEQLGVHAKNLIKLQAGEVSLFQRGYGKDSAAIAKEAIAFAQKNGFDVVLIDTAGRMQNNVSLMKALAKLVADNQPDKVIFVGEALVGNEAVDQLSKFNQALADFSGAAVPRRIDGIILTKFDTIDDKVGAALSMSYTSRAPILFVGTGQTYTDLKKMNVSHVVSALLRA
ncbi:hypothetical protein DSO57_1008782 [Entomophthora muscae]|uniref:Uncharacterized protein n=1 Tax=Entomophthora muscae TaxID=34485 RepID=A0ACC2UGR1_9FUNG|nr:hypothetical protein DSO57_1008782 [Entomophthora muscae]